MTLGGLPPIQLLATFEAAARLGSFKAAAREIHLTPSAVSQQIKALEEALGVALFDRHVRAVTLTEAGAMYLEVTRETLEAFHRGTTRVRDRFRRRIVRISAEPAIAHEILIPGLPAFHDANADVDLRIEASAALVDLTTDPVDAAIRFGQSAPPRLASRRILRAIATPVASPELLKRTPLRAMGDLAEHTLLRVQGAPSPWENIAAVGGFRIRRVVTFDSYLGTLQAAAHGVGVAVGLFPVSTAWIHDRRLEAPLPLRADAGEYRFVLRSADDGDPSLAVTEAWARRLFNALPPLDASE